MKYHKFFMEHGTEGDGDGISKLIVEIYDPTMTDIVAVADMLLGLYKIRDDDTKRS